MTVRSGVVGIWIIATGVLIALLYLGRSIFAPFALAVFLFLTMEGFARVIREQLPVFGRYISRLIAILIVLLGFGLFVGLMAQGIAQFGGQASDYEAKINGLIADGYGLLKMERAPTLTEIIFNDTGQRFFATIANATGDLSADLVVILIYVAFLFLAQSAWAPKLDRLFPVTEQREQVRKVGEAARRGIEIYLWTQTVISALITGLTYVTLLALGVENALFLSGLIFVLNYIPTIGSIVAAFVPTLFALVQPDMPAWVPGSGDNASYFFALFVFLGVSFWQFMIGNFVQPRIMGETLNLSALVVLLSLAIWGVIWGIPGMFLSAPLTVLLMVLFSQSSSTRWIAILLSADGNPGGLVANPANDDLVITAETSEE
ncbi:AI-2E family transporter [Henriciella aquimarina]|uniref:AI-2E family transporter n=1 Tax=Henriciella aquimarina TaxID=545261 RepID=UPI000A0786B2|nr:AI-2E family transporter [Henriciella aquimarina]